MVDVPKWTKDFVHKLNEATGLVNEESFDEIEKYCNEGIVETITDDDIPVQRIYSDKNIVVIKKKGKKQ